MALCAARRWSLTTAGELPGHIGTCTGNGPAMHLTDARSGTRRGAALGAVLGEPLGPALGDALGPELGR
jgi:hypothetical protein